MHQFASARQAGVATESQRLMLTADWFAKRTMQFQVSTVAKQQMGPDAIELILAVEDEFRVRIPDSDAERLTTPGAFADYLATRLRRSASDPCPPQVGFYRPRGAIASEFGISRREIRPTTPPRNLLTGDLRSSWQRLQKSAGAKHFPRLRRQRPLFLSAVVMPPIAVGLTVASLGPT